MQRPVARTVAADEQCPLPRQRPAEGKPSAAAVQHRHRARAQRRVFAQRGKRAVKLAQRRVLASPRVKTAVKRVAVAGHARLVAVINARRTGERELQKRRHAQKSARAAIRFLIHVALRQRRAVRVQRVDQVCDGARRIVRGQQRHAGAEYVGGIIFRQRHHPLAELASVVLAADKAQDRLAPGVIHHAVQLAVRKIPPPHAVSLFIRRVLPDLAEQDRVGVQLPNAPAQAEHKLVRQLIDHVQPEAVRAQRQPVRDHAVRAPDDVVHVRRLELVDTRQRRDAPPARVHVGIVLEREPAAIRRALVVDGALKIRAAAADVRKYAVEHDLHAQLVRRRAQRRKIRLRAEHRVDALIVIGVIAVVRPRHKNGVEVQNFDAQIVQIRQLFADTVEIPAVKVVVQHLAVGVRPPDGHVLAVFMHPVGLQFLRAVARPGSGKAVGKNLIHHRAAQCVRHGKARIHAAHLPEVARLHVRVAALLIQAERLVLRRDAEIVKIQPRLVNGKFPAPGLIQRILCGARKRNAPQLLPRLT